MSMVDASALFYLLENLVLVPEFFFVVFIETTVIATK